MAASAWSEGRQLLHNNGKSDYSIVCTETETPQTDLYRKRPPTAVDMMALPTKNVPIRVAALLSRIPTNITSRAVSFLKMTNAQRIAMRFFILAALLFVGESRFFLNFKVVLKQNIKRFGSNTTKMNNRHHR